MRRAIEAKKPASIRLEAEPLDYAPPELIDTRNGRSAIGPWSDRMGYGPLVRAATGVTWLWTSKDAEPDSRPVTQPAT